MRISKIEAVSNRSSYESPLNYGFANDGTTHHISLAHGIVWPSGAVLMPVTQNFSGELFLYGYLANN